MVDPRIVREVVALAGDDLAAATEVVVDAKETGCLEQGPDAWRLVAPLPTRRLVALVASRNGELPPHLRREACLLALGSPLTIRVAGAVLAPRGIRELEALGWARFCRREGGQRVVVADPPTRVAVLADVDDDERTALIGCLAAALEAGREPLQGDDLLRVARWRLRVGGWSAEGFARAAAHAHAASESGLAAALAAKAEELGEGCRATVLQATAQARAYAALLHALDDDPARVDTMLADGGAPDPETRIVGEVAAASSAAARLDRPGIKRAAAVVAELNSSPAEFPLAAHLVRGLVILDADARPPQDRLHTVAGELDHAIAGPDAVLAWWTTVAGRLHLAAGDLAAANDRFTEAMFLTERADPVRLRPRSTADLALIAALRGLPTEARRLLDTLGSERTASTVIATRSRLVDVLIAACERGPDAANQRALRCGDEAISEGRNRDAVFAWHLAARFGDARAAAERLTGDHALPDHPMVASVRRHALAVAGGDVGELLTVAKQLAAGGRYLVAAETAAVAARSSGDEAALALARGLAAACSEVRIPALDGIEPVVLSPRRGEVARCAVDGLDGATLADRLGLSARTVNNHLARVYRQLGVRGRRELQEVYRPDRRPLAP